MLEKIDFWLFLAIFFAYISLWARINPLINSGRFGGPRVLRRISYRTMGLINIKYNTIEAILGSTIYYSGAILGILALFFVYHENIINYFYIEERYISFVVMGALTEISLTSVINGISISLTNKTAYNITNEISKIKWIEHISHLPGFGMPLASSLGGFFEEIIFRGVFMIIALEHYHIDAYIVIILSALLFIYDQIIQLDTLTQIYIIGPAALVISIVGALMVVHTGSILPAVVAHTSFVIFYMSNPGISSSNATFK